AAETRDIASLELQGLLERRQVALPDARLLEVVALTRAGRALLEAGRPRGADDAPQRGGERGSEQRFYSGFVRPRDLAHDACLYPHGRERTKRTGSTRRTRDACRPRLRTARDRLACVAPRQSGP